MEEIKTLAELLEQVQTLTFIIDEALAQEAAARAATYTHLYEKYEEIEGYAAKATRYKIRRECVMAQIAELKTTQEQLWVHQQ